MNNKPKNILIDLFGVLFLANKKQIMYEIGVFNLTKFYFKYWCNPLDHCLTILDTMRSKAPGEFQSRVAYRGKFLPESLCKWQKGHLTNSEALEKVCSFITSLSQSESKDEALMLTIAKILFSSNSLLKAIVPNTVLINHIKELSLKKNIYIISNIDLQTWEKLHTLYADFFNCTKGHIVSCKSGLLKPDLQIFTLLCSTYDLIPQECLFIDDQLENIYTAQKLGMRTYHYKGQKNLESLGRISS